jgi:hypothetical protein
VLPDGEGALPIYLTRLDFIALDELGFLPFAQAGGQFLFHLISRFCLLPPFSPSANG